MATPSQGYPGTMSSASSPHYHPTPSIQPMTPVSTPQPMMEQSPTKDINTSALCLVGQETVNDIVHRTSELFQTLRVLQLPNGVSSNMVMFQEKRAKVNDLTEAIRGLFHKLRVCYNRVLADTASLEPFQAEDLIPYTGSDCNDSPGRNTDVYRYVTTEHQETVEQLRQKNAQQKEIIDQLRSLVWEINTMIAMRKS